MAYVQLPIRTSADLNSALDINQLMENCEWLRLNVSPENIEILNDIYVAYSGAVSIDVVENLNADMLDGYHASSFKRYHSISYLSK